MRNCTPTTATLSEALAETVTVLETELLFAGVDIDIVGGMVSATLFTVTDTAVAVPLFPVASRATALRLWVPFVVLVVSQLRLKGEAVFSAPKFAPSRRNCTPTTQTLSE